MYKTRSPAQPQYAAQSTRHAQSRRRGALHMQRQARAVAEAPQRRFFALQQPSEPPPPLLADPDVAALHFEKAMLTLSADRVARRARVSKLQRWFDSSQSWHAAEIGAVMRAFKQLRSVYVSADLQADAVVQRMANLLQRGMDISPKLAERVLRAFAHHIAEHACLQNALSKSSFAQDTVQAAMHAAAGCAQTYSSEEAAYHFAMTQLKLGSASQVFWQRLGDHGLAQYDAETVGLLIHRAATLHKRGLMSRPSAQLIAALNAAIELRACDMDMQRAGNCWWAAAKLRCRLSAGAHQALLQRTMQLLPTADGRDVACMLWAVAVSKEPGLAALHWPLRSAALAALQSMSGSDLGSVMLALSVLDARDVSSKLPDAYYAAIEKRASKFEAADLSRVLTALARRCASVPDRTRKILRAAVWRTARSEHAARPDTLASMLWACARLGGPYLDDVPWEVLRQVQLQCGAMCARNLSVTLWALGRLQAQGDMPLQHSVATALHERVYEMNSRELICTHHALAQLQWQLNGNAQEHVLLHVAHFEQHLSAQDVAMLACALVRDDHVHDAQQLWPAVYAGAVREAHNMTAQGVANTLWAIARCGAAPHSTALCALLDALQRTAITMHVPEVAMTWWALAQLYPAMRFHALHGGEWAGPLLRATQREASAFGPADAACVLWGVAKSHTPFDWPFEQALLLAAEETCDQMAPRDVAQTVWAFVKLRMQHGGHWGTLDMLLRAAIDATPEMRALDIAQLLWALGTVNASEEHTSLSDDDVAMLVSALVREFPNVGATELPDILRALATLGIPLIGALRTHSMTAVQRMVCGMNSWEVCTTIRALSDLCAPLSYALQQELHTQLLRSTAPSSSRKQCVLLLQEIPLLGELSAGASDFKANRSG